MIDVEAKTGLVGFFDILGYQQMLLANDVSSTARIVVDVLSEVPDTVVSGVLDDQGLERADDLASWPEFSRYFQGLVREEMDWLLFSDTILVSLPLRIDRDIIHWATSVVGFVEVCAVLLRQMFDVGLPLRGGVSFGEFFIQDTYFAGQPIIDAYRHSESLDLSGCVLAPSVERMYRQMRQHAVDADYEESVRSMLDQLCVSYLIPRKRDRVETGLMVNWVNLPMRSFEGLPADLREYVYSSFVAHNKDVVPAVQPKIDNTEAFVRKIVRNIEPRPWPWMTRRMDEAFRDLESGGRE
ncbi:MAG: hypothetical protein PVG27_02660 [Chloroflexota bacterium]|jgi:hypothetical protein